MAAKKKATALDFARAYLIKKPSAPYAEVRDSATKKGLTLYPISYGRAKALEGLVAVAPYGTKKKKVKSGRGPGRPKGSKNKKKTGVVSPGRGPGRPRKTTGLEGIDGLVQTIQNLQRERDDAQAMLEKIRALLG